MPSGSWLHDFLGGGVLFFMINHLFSLAEMLIKAHLLDLDKMGVTWEIYETVGKLFLTLSSESIAGTIKLQLHMLQLREQNVFQSRTKDRRRG